MSQNILQAYNEELASFRKEFENFSQQNPRVANNLRLNHSNQSDPFICHLIESFSYISAKIKQEVNDGHKEFTQTILQHLYPQFIKPLPSISMMELKSNLNSDQAIKLPKNTKISINQDNEKTPFRTTHNITALPLAIESIKLVRGHEAKKHKATKTTPSGCLEIKMTINENVNLNDFTITEIPLHLNIDPLFVNQFYEMVLNQAMYTRIICDEDDALIDHYQITPGGFTQEESLLSNHSHLSNPYNLLSEYFHYPEKFQKIILVLNKPLNLKKRSITFSIYLNQYDSLLASQIESSSLKLNCVPIINLSNQTAEPIHLIEGEHEYLIKVDSYKNANENTVHTIKDVRIIDTQGTEHLINPYFNSANKSASSGLFWHEKRIEVEDKSSDSPRQDVFIVLTDENNELHQFIDATLRIEIDASNHLKARHIINNKAEFIFRENDTLSYYDAHLLHSFVDPSYISTHEKSHWNLIRLINLDHIPLDNQNNALKWLAEILFIFDTKNKHSYLCESISSIETELIFKRHPSNIAHSFCQGTQINIKLNNDFLPHYDLYLLISLLAQFFETQCLINSFTQTRLLSHDGEELATWDLSDSKKGLL
jgi:type VI secretion system protein ImpG